MGEYIILWSFVMANVRALEAKLWESADLLRAESKMTSTSIEV